VEELCIALPVQPGKTQALREFVKTLKDTRWGEYEDLQMSPRVQKVTWSLQSSSHSDQLLIDNEGEDFARLSRNSPYRHIPSTSGFGSSSRTSRELTFAQVWADASRPVVGTQLQTALEFTKWSLRHDKPKQAYARFRDLDTLTLNVALNTFRNVNATQWGPIMAGSTVAVVPVPVVFLVTQRYFVEGIQLTGLSGR